MESRLFDGGEHWVNIQPEYAYDENVVVKNKQAYQTADGTVINTNQLFTDVIDQSINQHTCMYLTDINPVDKYIGLKTNIREYPYSYITYITTGGSWSKNVSDSSPSWYVKDDTNTEEDMNRLGLIPEFGFDRQLKDLDNQMLFKVTLLDNRLLQISHWDTYKSSFLTLVPDEYRVVFSFENNLPKTADNPQVFEYSLSRTTGYLNLYMELSGEYFELKYVPNQKKMTLTTTTCADYVPTNFRTAPPGETDFELPITDSWVSYTTGQQQNNLDINNTRSYDNLRHNFLITSVYAADDIAQAIKFNILPLKNHITNGNRLSRNNPFPYDSDTEFRHYTGINTGGNQKLGYENISLNYNDYTSSIVFETDKLTYFHTPPSLHPYDRINIKEAGLIESGSIAGDQPIRSDKVWKKRANYKDYGHWGDSIDEQSGEYLCTWLYWSGLSTDKPMWLDRYYNPRNYTIAQALTVTPIVEFTSTFDNMNLDNPSTEAYVVYDKASDMCFEPSNLYCYHRIGATDIQYSINRLSDNIIQNDFDTYLNSVGGTPPPVFDSDNRQEYSFTGDEYTSTKTLNNLRESNEISYNYSMYSDDWSVKFGNTVMGNYTEHGVSIVNDKFITPILFDTKKMALFNTDLQALVTRDIESVYSFYSTRDSKIFTFSTDLGGTLYECSVTGTISEKTVVKKAGLKIKTGGKIFYHDDDYLYIYYNKNLFATVDLKTENIQEYTGEFIHRLYSDNDSTHPVKSIAYLNGILYTSSAEKLLPDEHGKLWWLKNSILWWYDPVLDKTREFIKSREYIFRDFILDTNDEITILYRPHSPEVVYEPVNNEYLYFYDLNILKVNRERLVVKDVNITDLAPSLSAFPPDGKFKLLRNRQHVPGKPVDSYQLLTEYVSSYRVVTDETATTEETILTHVLELTTDFDVNLETTTLQTIDNFINVDNSFNHIKNNHNTDRNILDFTIKLNNLYDRDQFEIINCPVDVTGLDPGWHHFAYDYSASFGKILVFVDGQLANVQTVQPQKYRFSEFNVLGIVAGKRIFNNGIHFDDFLKQPGSYYSSNYKIKNLYVYNKSINYFDLKYFYRQLGDVRDLTWVIPSDSRNYLDEIQHVFQHKRPYTKTGSFDLNILCSSLQDERLKQQLETDIVVQLQKQIPINTDLVNFNWYKST